MNQTLTALLIWIHLAAVVMWVGLIINSAVVFFPAIDGLTPDEWASSLTRYRKKSIIVSIVAIVILFIVGTILVIDEASAGGTPVGISSGWGALIAIKHVLVGAMLVLQAVAIFGVQPRVIGLLKTFDGGALDPKQQNQVYRLSNRNRYLSLLTGLLGFAVLLVIAFVVTFY